MGGNEESAEGERDEGEVAGKSSAGGILDNLPEAEEQNGDIE